jgi:glycosyltransferase involved in cell wall biosynthesis
VGRFLLIDNESTDGTTEYLRTQSDVSVFITKESYAESNCGVTWINEVLDSYVQNRWALILDADELFVYPRCETVDVQLLIGYLDSVEAQAMMAPLLDMYSKSPIRDTGYIPGKSLIEACPYFDGDTYDYADLGSDGSKVRSRGGARHRLFWQGRRRDHPSPFLPKIPLVKWQPGFALEASTHTMPGAKLTEATGVLLHFKFLQDFAERAGLEADRKEHFKGARQYAAYSEVLSANSDLAAYYDGSVRYEDSLQLVRLGLMNMPGGFPQAGDQADPTL